MDSIAAGELPQADGISWKYKNSIEFPKTDHELSGHGRTSTESEFRLRSVIMNFANGCMWIVHRTHSFTHYQIPAKSSDLLTHMTITLWREMTVQWIDELSML